MKIASIAHIKAYFSAYIKESQSGPLVITRNGKPAAVLLNIVDEDELEGLILAYSPKFQALLRAARQELQATGGIPHEEFWRQVEAEYDEAPVPRRSRQRRAPQKKGQTPKTSPVRIK